MDLKESFYFSFSNEIRFDEAFASYAALACLAEKINLLEEEQHYLDYDILKNYVKKNIPSLIYPVEILSGYIVPDKIKKIINTIINNYRSNLKEIIDTILEISCINKDTPEWLNYLAVQIIQPKDGLFYDGAAGLGNTLISADSYSKENNGKLKCYAQEISVFIYSFGMIRLYIYELDYHFECGDTILSPKYINNNEIKKFDYSIMFPPLGARKNYSSFEIKNDRYNRFTVNKINSFEELLIMHQIASLNNNGIGFILMSSGTMFSKLYEDIRKHILSIDILECVIFLPMSVLWPQTNISSCILILNKSKKEKKQIFMINAENLFVNKLITHDTARRNQQLMEISKKILKLYHSKKAEESISGYISVENLQETDISPQTYFHKNIIISDEFGKVEIDLNKKTDDVEWCYLKDTGNFYRGLNTSNFAEQNDNGNIKIIKLSDVQNGYINFYNIDKYTTVKDYNQLEKYFIKENDILISCKGPTTKICIVENNKENIVLSLNFIGIRVNTKKFMPEFLKTYLESPIGSFYIQSRQKGSSIIMLNQKDLETVPIPNISLEKQKEYVKRFQEIDDEIEKQIDALYEEKKLNKLNYYKNIGIYKMMNIKYMDI